MSRYEAALRSIGAWIDERHPHQMSILETAEGFAVRWQWTSGTRAAISRHFSHEELRMFDRRGQHSRLSLQHRVVPSSGEAAAETYQDLLRALGHEFDEVTAQSLLLDELDDGFLVTYQYRDPRKSTLWRKHLAIVAIDQQRSLLNQACARRRAKTGLSARLASTAGAIR